ncbi:unnamed protein product [Closterium sp. Yama58-4]|nr:unnamed protein product [Closterium sp. Yama58-4]
MHLIRSISFSNSTRTASFHLTGSTKQHRIVPPHWEHQTAPHRSTSLGAPNSTASFHLTGSTKQHRIVPPHWEHQTAPHRSTSLGAPNSTASFHLTGSTKQHRIVPPHWEHQTAPHRSTSLGAPNSTAKFHLTGSTKQHRIVPPHWEHQTAPHRSTSLGAPNSTASFHLTGSTKQHRIVPPHWEHQTAPHRSTSLGAPNSTASFHLTGSTKQHRIVPPHWEHQTAPHRSTSLGAPNSTASFHLTGSTKQHRIVPPHWEHQTAPHRSTSLGAPNSTASFHLTGSTKQHRIVPPHWEHQTAPHRSTSLGAPNSTASFHLTGSTKQHRIVPPHWEHQTAPHRSTSLGAPNSTASFHLTGSTKQHRIVPPHWEHQTAPHRSTSLGAPNSTASFHLTGSTKQHRIVPPHWEHQTAPHRSTSLGAPNSTASFHLTGSTKQHRIVPPHWEHVVAICTDGGSNYVSAGKLLQKKYPHLEFVPCATHVLDLLLEDFGGMDWAQEVVSVTTDMIAFLRSHTWTRAFLRCPELHGEKKSLQPLRPAGTRFRTQYIAVSRLREMRQHLVNMVTHKDWAEKGRKQQTGTTFEKAVMDVEWWGKVDTFVKVMELPYKLMRKTDGPAKGMMGALYDLMLQLTVDLTELLERADCKLEESDKEALLEHLRRRWDESLACPLHVVGRILNPVNQEEGIYLKDRECTRVMKQWLQRSMAFVDKGGFGSEEAEAGRAQLKEGKGDMAAWWKVNGWEYPELAGLARRAVSHAISASPCERGWSTWDGVHTARRNRLGSEKVRDLVFVAHNWPVVHGHHQGAAGGAGPIEDGEREVDEDDPCVDEYNEQEAMDKDEGEKESEGDGGDV